MRARKICNEHIKQLFFLFSPALADGLSHVVDILSNTVELSDPERWDAFEAQMDRGELESVQTCVLLGPYMYRDGIKKKYDVNPKI